MAKWLATAVDKASHTFFDGSDSGRIGGGGSIPFMDMLTKTFPRAQFFATGVLGPHSNAHGPNEFLHLDFGRRTTCAVAHIMGAYCEASVSQARGVVSAMQSSRLRTLMGSQDAKSYATNKFLSLLSPKSSPAAADIDSRGVAWARDVVADRDMTVDGIPLLEVCDRINDLGLADTDRVAFVRRLPLHPDTRLKLLTLLRLPTYEGELARDIASSPSAGTTLEPAFPSSNGRLDLMIHSVSSRAAYSMHQQMPDYEASHGPSPSKDLAALRFPHTVAAKGGLSDGIRPEAMSFIRESASPHKSSRGVDNRAAASPLSPTVSRKTDLDPASSSPRIYQQLRDAPLSTVKKLDIVQSLPVALDQKQAIMRAILADAEAS